MVFSEMGVALLRRLEGCRLVVYRDEAGKETVGIGHLVTDRDRATGRFLRPLTLAGAEALLREDIARFEAAIRGNVKVPLSQSQYDALVCFTFNTGAGPLFQGVGRALAARRYDDVPREMRRWNKIQDPKTKQLVTSRNLVARREVEVALWLREPAPQGPPPPEGLPSAA